jgi:hypothetical protein
MKTLVLFLVGIALVVSPALAADESKAPTGLGDLKWGATMEEAKEYCSRDQTDRYAFQSQQRCGRHFIAESPVYLVFQDGRFAGYTTSASNKSFSAYRDLVQARFGPPTRQRTETFLTRAATEFPNQILSWSFATSWVRLTQRDGSAGELTLVVFTKVYLEDKEQSRSNPAGTAAKSF